MKYNTLGKTGLQVSKLSFGAAPLGGEYGKIDPEEGKRSVHCAIDRGINYFDVAPYYGQYLAETRLGKALERKRKNVVLATKVGRYKTDHGEFFDFSSRGIGKALEKSMRRLRTDYIDIYQAHDIEFVSRDVIINEALPTMQRLKDEGKIRFIGITSYNLNILRDVGLQFDLDVILSYSRYNLTDTSLNEVMAGIVKKTNIGLINASPLNMGLLTSRGLPSWHPAPRRVIEKVLLAVRHCAAKGTNIERVALQFALSNELVATTMIGMCQARYVIENLEIMGQPVDTETIDEILKIIDPVKNTVWEEGIPQNFDPGSVPQFS